MIVFYVVFKITLFLLNKKNSKREQPVCRMFRNEFL